MPIQVHTCQETQAPITTELVQGNGVSVGVDLIRRCVVVYFPDGALMCQSGDPLVLVRLWRRLCERVGA